MIELSILSFFAAVATAAPAYTSLSGISWGPGTVDVFGLSSDNYVLHKYYRAPAGSWEPAGPYFENMNTSHSLYGPSAISTQPNRADVFYVSKDGQANLRYWLGSEWSPKSPENLGGNLTSPLALASWGPNRVNIVARGGDGQYCHKYWDGTNWQPSQPEPTWEDMGGNFSSAAAMTSWGENRLDIFGIDNNGALKHKYWDGYQWKPSIQEWEDMGGGPFIGDPVASSWGSGRLDMWAIGQDKALYHKYWDQSYYSNWESLGGSFESAPKVIHWWPNRIDIVGTFTKDDPKDKQYYYKYWDGSKWNPSPADWYNKGGSFYGEPAVVAAGQNNLNIMGLGGDGKIKLQVWDGSQWLPNPTGWWDLGDTQNAFQQMDKWDL